MLVLGQPYTHTHTLSREYQHHICLCFLSYIFLSPLASEPNGAGDNVCLLVSFLREEVEAEVRRVP